MLFVVISNKAIHFSNVYLHECCVNFLIVNKRLSLVLAIFLS